MAGAEGAAAAAAYAAYERRRRMEEEEEVETMKQLAVDHGPEWEFKIVRAVTRRFRDPATLRHMLQEESGAGWELVEKLDDQRVRLRRPVARRARDADLAVDAYRTRYGMGEGTFAGIVVALTLGAVALVTALIFLLVLLLV